MKSNRYKKRLLAFLALVPVLSILACTANHGDGDKIQAGVILKSQQTCGEEQNSAFSRAEGQTVNVEKDLPQGLFLYSSAEITIEKASKSGFVPQIVIREIPAQSKGDRLRLLTPCASPFESPFEFSLNGFTKIESHGSQQIYTSRQFQIYGDRTQSSVTTLNPKILPRAQTLKQLLNSGHPQNSFIRLADGTYVLHIYAEKGQLRAHLALHYDLVDAI